MVELSTVVHGREGTERRTERVSDPERREVDALASRDAVLVKLRYLLKEFTSLRPPRVGVALALIRHDERRCRELRGCLCPPKPHLRTVSPDTSAARDERVPMAALYACGCRPFPWCG